MKECCGLEINQYFSFKYFLKIPFVREITKIVKLLKFKYCMTGLFSGRINLFSGRINLAIIAHNKCPLKLMFQLYMTLSVTKIMARVKCAILMLRNHVKLMLPR